MKNWLDTDSMALDSPPGTTEEANPEQGLELHVGSNVFRTTNGVVKVQGKEHLVLEVRLDPPALFLTMDLYDEQGRRIGHLRRNSLSASSADRFAVSSNTTPDLTINDSLNVMVVDRLTGRTLIEAYLFQKRKIRIASGQFYSHKGEFVFISPHYCRIGTGFARFGDVIESRGGTAAIG